MNNFKFETAFRTKKLSKYELLKTSWTYQFKEFFNYSNLHGIRFVAEKTRPFHEKFVWFCSIVISLLITSVVMWSLWEKFQTSPTITGLETQFADRDIPFPSITICLEDPTNLDLTKNYITDHLRIPVDNTKYEYYENFVVRMANLTYQNFQNIKEYVEDASLNELNLKQMLTKVVKRCDDLLHHCQFKGETFNCCKWFLPAFTDRGFCYSFNSKYFDEEFLTKPKLFWQELFDLLLEEKGHNRLYELLKKMSFHIRKILDPTLHVKDLLQLAGNETISADNVDTKFIYETDEDFSLQFHVEGSENPISLYIHSSAEKIVADSLPHHVWTRRISKILFSPKETYTTSDARQLSIGQRHCVFPDEIHLVTDSVYTYNACMTQCRMNMAEEKCGCVPFFYSRIKGYEYCNLKGLDCIRKFADEIREGLNCQCELGCSNIVYDIEKLEEIKYQNGDINDQLEIGFLSWPVIRYKRDVLFGWIDLFVAFGGIAGSFLGFSIFSAIEIIYFFTLRTLCMVYKEEEKLQKLHDEYENAEEPEVDFTLSRYFRKSQNEKQKLERIFKNEVAFPYLP